MDRAAPIALALAHEMRARQIREADDDRRAAEHRRAAILAAQVNAQPGARARRPRNPVLRGVGRSLIRLGRALAAEPDPTLRPARPR
jgi:hypothetical protein